MFEKSLVKIQVLLNTEKNREYFTLRTKYIYEFNVSQPDVFF